MYERAWVSKHTSTVWRSTSQHKILVGDETANWRTKSMYGDCHGFRSRRGENKHLPWRSSLLINHDDTSDLKGETEIVGSESNLLLALSLDERRAGGLRWTKKRKRIGSDASANKSVSPTALSASGPLYSRQQQAKQQLVLKRRDDDGAVARVFDELHGWTRWKVKFSLGRVLLSQLSRPSVRWPGFFHRPQRRDAPFFFRSTASLLRSRCAIPPRHFVERGASN